MILIYKKKLRIITTLFLMALNFSCETKIYPDERLEIDTKMSELFLAITHADTLVFDNLKGRRKQFVITGIDTFVLNKKGWFINGGANKTITMTFKEIGTDTTKLYRQNEVSVEKAPTINISSISIQFNNFYYSDTILPKINSRLLEPYKVETENCYFFKTSLISKNFDDVEELFIHPNKGIVLFKTLSNEIWLRRTPTP